MTINWIENNQILKSVFYTAKLILTEKILIKFDNGRGISDGNQNQNKISHDMYLVMVILP